MDLKEIKDIYDAIEELENKKKKYIEKIDREITEKKKLLDIPVKKCSKCNKEKLIDCFYKHPKGLFGCHGKCKACFKKV